VFEPIHGSWPQAKGLNIANPLAQILSVAMLFEYFDLNEEGDGYLLSSVGDCTDTEIIMPYTFEGLPVVGITCGFQLPETVTSFAISGNVKEISDSLLYYGTSNTTLKTLIFMEGVERIGSYAFYDFKALEKVVMPTSVEYIGSHAFAGEHIPCYYAGTAEEWLQVDVYWYSVFRVIISLDVTKTILASDDTNFAYYSYIPEEDTVLYAYIVGDSHFMVYLDDESLPTYGWEEDSVYYIYCEMSLEAGQEYFINFNTWDGVEIHFTVYEN
jgi:hypothetical protein